MSAPTPNFRWGVRTLRRFTIREIITDRLILSNFNRNDTKSLYELILDYRESPTYRYDHRWPDNLAEYEAITEWFSNGDDFLAVRKKTNPDLIGFVSLARDETTSKYNLGFVFDARYHNNGFAFEACRSYLSYMRSHDVGAEVVSGTAKENVSAHKLLLKLGFVVSRQWRGSFQKDESNAPIEFDGYEYVWSTVVGEGLHPHVPC